MTFSWPSLDLASHSCTSSKLCWVHSLQFKCSCVWSSLKICLIQLSHQTSNYFKTSLFLLQTPGYMTACAFDFVVQNNSLDFLQSDEISFPTFASSYFNLTIGNYQLEMISSTNHNSSMRRFLSTLDQRELLRPWVVLDEYYNSITHLSKSDSWVGRPEEDLRRR